MFSSLTSLVLFKILLKINKIDPGKDKVARMMEITRLRSVHSQEILNN